MFHMTMFCMTMFLICISDNRLLEVTAQELFIAGYVPELKAPAGGQDFVVFPGHAKIDPVTDDKIL